MNEDGVSLAAQPCVFPHPAYPTFGVEHARLQAGRNRGYAENPLEGIGAKNELDLSEDMLLKIDRKNQAILNLESRVWRIII